MATFYKFDGYGNYSESFGWDNGITMNTAYPTILPLGEVEKMNDLPRIPEVGKWVELYVNSYGGSRNATIIVSATNIEEAIEVALQYEATYPEVDY